ncbi:MAG: pantetheine-phosphate adenylyltransferase [Candidatus Marinimicrobia bacterium]|nr:pantetheine-phosphate adenylyltransferase [Candidatus Neomarinimicrobiota bacterium]MBL7023362.1 pantetheine-phosphate adenylyltransferase [Candidatus Neomarinimicrobiota bacterium]MBL7109321.1 pantetheine-phosphate adenylyltransferase [Candidatus Neomarinimicrobiota bacterium]
MKIAIYPGSFDPITNGHIDIIERAVGLFDKVIVAVSKNFEKNPLFSERERLEMIEKSVVHLDNVVVDSFQGLLVNYASENNAKAIIRGLRALSDFEFEFKMALMNRSLKDEVTTVFLMPHAKYTHLSSSLVREVGELNGDVSKLVPSHVMKAVKEKFGIE